MTKEETLAIVSKHSEIIELGASDDAPSNEWIKKAEEKIGYKFSESYLWFLKNFGGGSIVGDEIYSIYQIPFEEAIGGDIVYNYLLNIKNSTAEKNQVYFMETDLGEYFFFDYSNFDGNECPIMLGSSNDATLYANDFYEFICKRVKEVS